MIIRLKLALPQAEYSALLDLAVKELRNPEAQIRHIVREELKRQELLPADALPAVELAQLEASE